MDTFLIVIITFIAAFFAALAQYFFKGALPKFGFNLREMLGPVAIISSPFILNSPPVFYICVILTIIAGLYLSRNIAYKESTHQNERKRTKARRPKRRRR